MLIACFAKEILPPQNRQMCFVHAPRHRCQSILRLVFVRDDEDTARREAGGGEAGAGLIMYASYQIRKVSRNLSPQERKRKDK